MPPRFRECFAGALQVLSAGCKAEADSQTSQAGTSTGAERQTADAGPESLECLGEESGAAVENS